MRRSTPGVFSSMEPHTPRVCGPKSKTSFRANSDDSRRCTPPPVPCRNQPPPLPPKHYIRKNSGVEFSKHREVIEPLDYGKYVYETVNDCCNRSAPYESRTFKLPFSTFPIDPNTEMLKGPCTCSLGTCGGTKPSFNSNSQSPVWSKMPSRPSDSSQSKTHPSSSSIRDPPPPPNSEKISSNVDNRPWTLSRFSRTMSRFFRLKGSHRNSKSNSIRSRSVYFTDFPDKFGVNATPEPCSMRAMRSPVTNSPVVTLPSSPTLPLPPTRKVEPGTSTALCHDAVQTIMPSSADLGTCSSPTGISCVHHVHHIHHVHHVHHHLHHLPPPPTNSSIPPPSLPLPVSSPPSVAPTTTTSADDAAALIMMLESGATLGETPPPISVLKDSKTIATTEQQIVGNAGNSHTYSAYGVRGGGGANAGPCCPIEPVPSQQGVHTTTTSTTLHRQNTVCSNPRCITTTTHSCRPHVQGSPCDHLRTPTSIELAELAEAGAEAVFATNGRPTATSSGSFTVEPPHLSSSPLNTTTTTATQQHNINASAPNSPAPGSSGQTHLMHHMHHHHMHHMLHHLRTPSVPTSTSTLGVGQNTTTATSAQSVPTSASNQQSSTNAADHRSSFQESMKALRKMGWYWGPLSFTEAEKLLANRPDGTFLVRDSAHDTFFLSLSFRVRGTTYHTRIEHNQGRFSFWFEPESHSASTVVEFIEKAVAHSIGGKYHYFLQTSTPGQQPVEVSLLYPLSRFQVVQSLKHLARFTILSHVRRDHVARLPLPPSQIGYLLEKQVYWESLEDFEEAIRDRPPLQFPLRSSSPQKP